MMLEWRSRSRGKAKTDELPKNSLEYVFPGRAVIVNGQKTVA
jgi:hypothetical protein